MKTLGLTGGIGMGKSTAAEILRTLSVPVVDTDDLARQQVQPGKPALAEISAAFGKNILTADGHLRRDELARLVFTDPIAREKLEAILHPVIRTAWLAQIEIWRAENHPLAVVVIPLLFETHAESHFDKIICVTCSCATQHERLLARGWNPEQIRQRRAAQWPVEQKIGRADFVIWTEGTLSAHEQQLRQILRFS
ncbi:MAG: dephospho-CoA kinase [Limisphaerales bacterium]